MGACSGGEERLGPWTSSTRTRACTSCCRWVCVSVTCLCVAPCSRLLRCVDASAGQLLGVGRSGVDGLQQRSAVSGPAGSSRGRPEAGRHHRVQGLRGMHPSVYLSILLCLLKHLWGTVLCVLCAALHRKPDFQTAWDQRGRLRQHWGQSTAAPAWAQVFFRCSLTSHEHEFVWFQRISLVSSFAASLFLGGYAAIDYSDGTVCSVINVVLK